MTTAAPPMRFALGALLPLKGEDCENDDVLTIQGLLPARVATAAENAGPLRLLRRHLPLRGGGL